MARLRKRARRVTSVPEVSLTPLIDTALTLLVIFMVTAPMMQNNIKVDLPQGQSKELAEQQELVVTLNKQGALFFNSYPVKKEQLALQVQEKIAGAQATPVYVRADKAVHYGQVVDIVETLKQAGVHHVALSIEMVA